MRIKPIARRTHLLKELRGGGVTLAAITRCGIRLAPIHTTVKPESVTCERCKALAAKTR